MRVDELGRILRSRYMQAALKRQAVEVVVFGIEFADELKSKSVAEVCSAADIGKWSPQVSLGVNLASRVVLKK